MKEFLDYASKKYYEGSPVISDDEFDRLAELFRYEYVGYSVSADTVPHMFPMFSLQKIYPGDSPPNLSSAIVTPKLDGAAVSLTYSGGELVLAATRGDGVRGQNVTIKLLELVPFQISKHTTLQISGEVVAPKTIENARNYAAGSLNLKSLEEFKTRDLTFVAYDVKPYLSNSWVQDLVTLRSFGFNTVIDCDWQQFPHDGKVVREDNYDIFERLGYTAHHPKGAYALKERPQGVITTLEGVEWQVGRSGVVSPVAILSPVQIEGAIVSRATLHNIKYIEDLGLEIGCKVEVIRAGEIIPRVVSRVYD